MENCYVYRKNGAVGDMTGNLILVCAVGIGGYLLYKSFFSGGSATDTNNAAIDANTAATVKIDQAAAAAAGIKQTLSDSTLSTLANSLYYKMGNDADPGEVNHDVSQVNNYVDWLRLVELYGTKKFNTGGLFSSCALSAGLWGCSSLDLGTTLKSFLPAQYLSNLNTYFSESHIPVIL